VLLLVGGGHSTHPSLVYRLTLACMLHAGKWRLVWSQQSGTANPLQKLGSKQVREGSTDGQNSFAYRL